MVAQRKAKRTDRPTPEVFGFRMDPRLRYIAELAARSDRRSLANFVERAIEQALMEKRLPGSDQCAWEESGHLWHISEARRFARLAAKHPDLLTYPEQGMKWVLDEVAVTDGKSGQTLTFKSGAGYDEALVEKCWTQILYMLDHFTDGRAKLEQAMQAAASDGRR